MFQLRKILSLGIIVFFVISAWCESPPSYAWRSGLGGGERRALIISGYHSFYPWTNTVLEGIYKTFRESRYEVEADTLEVDVLRISDPALRNRIFVERLKSLLRQVRYHVVILTDSDAMEAVKTHRAMFPPDIPMVFCGVVSRTGNADNIGIGNMTGVYFPVPLSQIVEIGARLMPEARRAVIISDTSSTGERVAAMARKILPNAFPRLAIEVWSGRDLSTGEMLLRFSRLRDDVFVVLSSWKYGKDERFIPQYELQQALKSRAQVPVFCFLKDWVEMENAVGGVVADGEDHGRMAAQLALKIFDGVSIADIPPELGKTEILFRYEMMRKFGLSSSRLPLSARVLHLPGVFFHSFYQITFAVLGGALLLLVLLGGLVIYILRYRKAVREQRQEIEKSLALLRVMPITMGVLNEKGEYLFLNNELELRKRHGIPADRAVTVFDLYEDDFARYLLAHVDIAKNMAMPLEVFYRYDGKEKRAVCLSLRKEIFGEPTMVFVSCDISEQRALERQQLETLEQLQILENSFRRAAALARMSWFLCDAKRKVLRSDNRVPVWKYNERGEPLRLAEVLSPEEAAEHRQLYGQLFSGTINEIEYSYHVDFAGDVHRFKACALRLKNNRYFISIMDETEAQQKYFQIRSLIDNLPCSLFAKDASGADYRYVMANRHMAMQLGIGSPEELEGHCDREWCDNDEILIRLRQIEEQALSKGNVSQDYMLTMPDGKTDSYFVYLQRLVCFGRVMLLGFVCNRKFFRGASWLKQPEDDDDYTEKQ